ncbi:MAG TPA: hypothetical protein VFA22_06710, partial [Stellaceae bacterium]|nr:hypothetical protein [Stellaceae bacterium]
MRTARKTATSRKPARRAPRAAARLVVLVATRKGAWLYHGDAARRSWRPDGPPFLGHTISPLVLDPR